MTKSRTLRKAGAVVLSLAMAFSVAGVAPSADAAAKKPALSAKKGTITVGKTKAVKIQNTTKKKVKKLVVSTSNKKVATVTKKNKVKFIVTGKKAGTAKITAKVTLKKKVAKKKVFTLKYTATVKAAATPAPAETDAPEVSVKLSYSDTIQADGTYLTGGKFTLSYGSALGTPQTITYYRNEEVVSVKTSDGGSLTEGLTYTEGTTGKVATKGKYYAVIKNTVGKEYTSNAITLTDAEAAAVIKDFAIIDDYDKTVTDVKDGSNLSFSATDDKAVIKVTLNKAYAGTFYVFEDGADKINTANSQEVAAKGTDKTGAGTDAISKSGDYNITVAKNFTASNAITATKTGVIRMSNEDSSVTYMFQTDSEKITRGKKYTIAFDQTNIETDNVASAVAKNGTLNEFATAAVAPYITAPASVTLDSPLATKTAYKVTLKDANGDGYAQLNSSINTSTTTIYTSAKKNVGSVKAYDKGVATVTEGNAAVTGIKYYAEWVGDKGIYGEAEVKVASPEVDVKTAAVATISATSAGDADVTVNVTLAGVQTAGKVYITSDLAKFDAAKADTYDSVSAAVAKDATSAKITSAVKKAGTTYYAVFVPDDTEKYGKVESAAFPVNAVIASYSMSELTDVVVGSETKAVLSAKDQFGNAYKTGSPAKDTVDQPTVTMIPVNEKDSTIIGAAANIDNTAKQSGTNISFAITAGANDGKWTITSGTGDAPTEGETWIGQLKTAAEKMTKSYLVAKCDSAAATYNASTWTLSIVQATGAASEIVPEKGKGTPTSIVTASGTKVEKISATAKEGSTEIVLYGEYYIVDQFGNKINTASKSDTNPYVTVSDAFKSGPSAGKDLRVSWNTSGKLTKLEYGTKPTSAGSDVTVSSKTYGAEITITVSANVDYQTALSEAKIEMDQALTALTTACANLAANTDPDQTVTLEEAAGAAKSTADAKIKAWENLSEKKFASDASTATQKTTYDADVTKIDDFNTAESAFSTIGKPTYTANDGNNSPNLSFTATTGWTYVFSITGDTDKASIEESTGAIAFTDNGTITVKCVASKDGFAKEVTVTGSEISMSDFNGGKTYSIS